jgi:hypothetical protein
MAGRHEVEGATEREATWPPCTIQLGHRHTGRLHLLLLTVPFPFHCLALASLVSGQSELVDGAASRQPSQDSGERKLHRTSKAVRSGSPCMPSVGVTLRLQRCSLQRPLRVGSFSLPRSSVSLFITLNTVLWVYE